MKRVDLIRHLEDHGCYVRDRGKHSVYVNPANNQVSAVPRHREINDFLARRICRDLGILNLDHTNPHRLRKNHSTPNRPTKSSKNGQVSQ